MDQDIMEVSYSDNVSEAQVITIDLHPSVPHNENVQATILYTSDGQSMTELQQSNENATNHADYNHQLENHKILPYHHSAETTTITTTTSTNNIINDTNSNNNNNNNGHNNQGDNDNKSIMNNNNDIVNEEDEKTLDDNSEADENNTSNGSKSTTRFKWTKEKSQVAMNLVKHGCKPKLVSVAVGCSLRTAQKFVETVTPKMEGESFKNYVIRRRGRKSKDVNERLDAIREVLSKDSSKTQVEIAADLKVSNTTVCRDLKRIKGNSWKEKRNADQEPGTIQQQKRETKKERQSSSSSNSSSINNKNKLPPSSSSPTTSTSSTSVSRNSRTRKKSANEV